eukprot:1157764-Pelagomonas_calceolata.AAC.18
MEGVWCLQADLFGCSASLILTLTKKISQQQFHTGVRRVRTEVSLSFKYTKSIVMNGHHWHLTLGLQVGNFTRFDHKPFACSLQRLKLSYNDLSGEISGSIDVHERLSTLELQANGEWQKECNSQRSKECCHATAPPNTYPSLPDQAGRFGDNEFASGGQQKATCAAKEGTRA